MNDFWHMWKLSLFIQSITFLNSSVKWHTSTAQLWEKLVSRFCTSRRSGWKRVRITQIQWGNAWAHPLISYKAYPRIRHATYGPTRAFVVTPRLAIRQHQYKAYSLLVSWHALQWSSSVQRFHPVLGWVCVVLTENVMLRKNLFFLSRVWALFVPLCFCHCLYAF